MPASRRAAADRARPRSAAPARAGKPARPRAGNPLPPPRRGCPARPRPTSFRSPRRERGASPAARGETLFPGSARPRAGPSPTSARGQGPTGPAPSAPRRDSPAPRRRAAPSPPAPCAARSSRPANVPPAAAGAGPARSGPPPPPASAVASQAACATARALEDRRGGPDDGAPGARPLAPILPASRPGRGEGEAQAPPAVPARHSAARRPKFPPTRCALRARRSGASARARPASFDGLQICRAQRAAAVLLGAGDGLLHRGAHVLRERLDELVRGPHLLLADQVADLALHDQEPAGILLRLGVLAHSVLPESGAFLTDRRQPFNPPARGRPAPPRNPRGSAPAIEARRRQDGAAGA